MFPCCESCNKESSGSDLLSAFMGTMAHDTTDAAQLSTSKGLMLNANRQYPKLLQGMVTMSSIEARRRARELGMRPQAGQLYREMGIANITDELDEAVKILAGKMTKALHFRKHGEIFPPDGGIQFRWFTNADAMRPGGVPELAVFQQFNAPHEPPMRNGHDLSAQFDYRFATAEGQERLSSLWVTFRQAFGFVCFSAISRAYLEGVDARMSAKTARDNPFRYLD